MPKLKRPGDVELHWESVGEGPAVVMAPAVFGNSGMFQDFVDDLSRDHTVIRYDTRGTGRSSRVGPHDLETGASDLEALIEGVGGPAVVIAFLDASYRAVRVAAKRPDLVDAVFAGGVPPINRAVLDGFDALAGSDAVVDTFLEMLDTYYASALRATISDANPQSSESEIRERVEAQLEYCPQEVAAARVRAFISDDALPQCQAIGERLNLITWPGGGRPWFPEQAEMLRIVEKQTPEARVHLLDNGLVSRPDQGAAIVRSVTQQRTGVTAAEH